MGDYGRPVQFGVFPTPNAADLEGVLAIAEAAASLDVLSGGRFELGLGAGAFWGAIAAMGGPRRTPGQAAGAMAEAEQIIRGMWSDQPSVRFEGEHYQVNGVKPGPRPAHDIGIWLGVAGPRLLHLVGRASDGWVPSNAYAPPERLPGMHARIDDGAEAAGRDGAAIQRVYNVFGTISNGPSRGPFDGPAEQWVEELTDLVVDGGMDTFIFGPATDPLGQTKVFAEDVAPAVRAAVAEHRGEV